MQPLSPLKLSANIVEAIKVLKDSKRQKHESIDAFLKEIVEEAQILADIWDQIVKSIIEGKEPDLNELDQKGFNKLKYKYGHLNASPYFALQSFYQRLSSALGDKLSPGWIDLIANSIGLMLFQRNLTRQALLESLGVSNRSKDNIDSRINEDQLLESVDIMKQEAAALKVLRQEFALKKW